MFERDVIIDGTVYNSHRVGGIVHSLGGDTTILVHHVVGDVFDANWIETQHQHVLDWELPYAEAEEWVKSLPEYEEYIDSDAQHMEELQGFLDELAGMLTDEQAASVPQAFKDWEPNIGYFVGDRRRYGDGLYKCLIAHTSVDGQTPDIAVSLWACILIPNPDIVPEWVQPDSTNPYMMGDKVTHNGLVWVSNIDYNVFEPGVAGWEEVTE